MSFPSLRPVESISLTTRRLVWQLCLPMLLLAALFFSGLKAHAQFETASVLGYIRDTSGAVIPGASVKLISKTTGVTQELRSDSEGKFEFTSVLSGPYTLEAEAKGFEHTTTDTFTVTVNARQRVDLSLKLGSAAETVTVSGAAALLETETSSRGQVVGQKEVEDLPLNGRSYADLALLVPGVRKSVLENQSTTSREASFNVNGQRSAFNNFLLDGLDNNSYGTSNQGFANENIPPSPDAISEFRLETNNYSAEYGRASGAVINATTRRGTNQFHGSIWEYNRNTNLNAIGPFQPSGNVKPTFIRNQFGGAFGGPILKDKLFFFMDYEGLRQITKAFTAVTLPTATQRGGTFVDSKGNPISLQNPITGTKYANGVIPQSDMTPFARAVLAALPANNASGSSNNYFGFPRGEIQDDKADGRIDAFINPRLVLFGRYSEHRGSIFDPAAIPGRAGGNGNGNVHILNRQIAIGATYDINSNSILDARIGVGWNEGGKTPIGAGQASLLTENGITNGLPTDARVVRSLNGQSINGFAQLGAQTSNPQFQNPFVINPKVNYTLLKGRHSMKFGYEFQSISTAIDDFNPVYGQDTYNGKFSAVGSTSTSDSLVTQAWGLADFMFGNRSNYQLNNFVIINMQQRMNFLYAQDDIKVNSRLTVNAGLRYELATPQWVDGNHLANFDPATNSLIQAKDGSLFDRARVHMPLTNFAPRIGLSYSVDPLTAIRAGYGISYTQFNREGGENLLAYNGPYIVNASIDQTPSLGLCTSDTQDQTKCFRQTQQGYSTTLVAPANFSPLKAQSRYIPKDNPTGYVQSWHLSVQRQLRNNMLFDVAYVGNHGVHLMVLGDYNQAAVQQAGQNLSLQARRPITNFGTIEVAFGGGYSNYNALQAKIEKRYSNGIYLLNSFTYSKTMDVASGHLETSGGDNSRVNIANIAGDYGRSSYDQPLNNTFTAMWDLPFFGAGHSHMTRTLLGGWQLSAINQLTSGLPVNLTYNVSTNNTVTGLYTYRPNVSGNPVTKDGQRVKTATAVTNYLTKTAVSAPAGPNPFGNASRNSVRSYPFYQLDTGLHKKFVLWSDSSALDFRAEAFNVLNQVNYMQPDGNVSNSSFGSITSAYPARQLQLALKLLF